MSLPKHRPLPWYGVLPLLNMFRSSSIDAATLTDQTQLITCKLKFLFRFNSSKQFDTKPITATANIPNWKLKERNVGSMFMQKREQKKTIKSSTHNRNEWPRFKMRPNWGIWNYKIFIHNSTSNIWSSCTLMNFFLQVAVSFSAIQIWTHYQIHKTNSWFRRSQHMQISLCVLLKTNNSTKAESK